jgi:hypothetical protein
MVSPFGSTLPLTSSPYNSRINSNYNSSLADPKNYYLLGFNPGYALQASELNEVQELFFINLNLTQRMNNFWTSDSRGYDVPFWEGMIPVSPQLISFTTPSLSGSTLTFTVVFNAGWYLWTDSVSKMSFWIYNNTARTQSVSVTGSGSVGFIGEKIEISCCPNDNCSSTQDSDIRDNSQGNTNTHNTCGASRKNVKLTNTEVRSSSINSSTYFPVLTITTNASASTYSIAFADGQLAYITP